MYGINEDYRMNVTFLCVHLVVSIVVKRSSQRDFSQIESAIQERERERERDGDRKDGVKTSQNTQFTRCNYKMPSPYNDKSK